MKRKRGFKPAYWWDYQHGPDGMVIVIETNDPRVKNPICRLSRGSHEEAEQIVDNLKVGRDEASDITREGWDYVLRKAASEAIRRA